MILLWANLGVPKRIENDEVKLNHEKNVESRWGGYIVIRHYERLGLHVPEPTDFALDNAPHDV